MTYKDSNLGRKNSKEQKWEYIEVPRAKLTTDWSEQGKGRTLKTNKDAPWVPSRKAVHKGDGYTHPEFTQCGGKSSPQDKTSPRGQVPPNHQIHFFFLSPHLFNLPVAVSTLDIFLNFEMTWFVALHSPLGESKPEPLVWTMEEGELQKRFPSKGKQFNKKHQH